jgi:hypothetical protein
VGGAPSGLANAPEMNWSPSETTGLNALQPQMRQVSRVTKMGENSSFDIKGIIARNQVPSKTETPEVTKRRSE